ncbi:sodium/proton antiporter, NhaA family [Flavobacterium segetis]|uniref:Na(+)/H(+) antiporter NhaA n=1 Tax=Flavobacterium segetis TaxID=271157 RepID=A0A1M5H407_9FLAO|nr:Na+/H+ antiporter NhaA [Flavobacterium segetis]SHG10684.1 sodium/proton antiporter, NhaA family [Flavobacterium segetis]
MNLSKLFKEFYESEKAGGLILLFVTIISLALANSPIQSSYISFWQYDMGGHSITHWINDALMAVFFLLIGLELEREIYKGELSDIKNASFPIIGAIGGFLIPAAIFLLFNYGTATQAGAGIPMATDIAFAIGILSLLGNRVPVSLKIFLTALAVIDDLIAIIVIAIFYTKTLVWSNLLLALAVFGILLILNRLKVKSLIPYLLGGVVMWFFMYNSGVHATITGVLLAFAIPFGNGDKKSTSYVLQHFLHKPVAFIILPLFAIANTSIAIGADWQNGLGEANSIGILTGLTIGKPLGIFAFAFTGALIGLCKLPKDLKWKNIIGVGFLGGIGFTMSIFITILAYDDVALINSSKIAIILASITAGIIGYMLLKWTLKPNAQE